jgi:cob(I)alamin adenosyltransferase
MKLYTKTGDSGTTCLYDGSRHEKSDIIFDVLGNNDELSSHIGLLIASLSNSKIDTIDIQNQLRTIQTNLQYINSILATPNETKQKKLRHISETDIKQIEDWIDHMEKFNPKLTSFILPGVTIDDAYTHICRTSCRKAERELLKSIDLKNITNNITNINTKNIMCYMNRLSDFFFSLARYICNVLYSKEDFKINM